MRGSGKGHKGASPPEWGHKGLGPVKEGETRGGVVRLAAASFMLVAAVALIPIALDWRSPLLLVVRPWALIGLIVVSTGLILAESRALWTSRRGQRLLIVLSAAGLLAAALALIITLALETRFHWVRRQVLHTDPVKMERVGRHIIVGYRSLEEVSELIRLRGVAGVYVSARNVRGKSVAEIRRDIDSLRSIRRDQGLPPLWIATDQEGGIVSRVSPPLRRLPPLSTVLAACSGVARRRRAVRGYALTQGRGLAELGINLNFAPVVDVNYKVMNPDDRFTLIHQRAISRDPAVVAQTAAWYCKALEETGVRCTLKHFPGLGRVFEDTHSGQANLAASVAELTTTDWVPFRTLMHETNAFIMLGHVRLQSIDGDSPVSASLKVVTGLLRNQWKYDGILITDNFTMAAIYRSAGGMENAAIRALNSGVDLILVSWDTDQYYPMMYALLRADEQGLLNRQSLKLSDRRLARAVEFVGRPSPRP